MYTKPNCMDIILPLQWMQLWRWHVREVQWWDKQCHVHLYNYVRAHCACSLRITLNVYRLVALFLCPLCSWQTPPSRVWSCCCGERLPAGLRESWLETLSTSAVSGHCFRVEYACNYVTLYRTCTLTLHSSSSSCSGDVLVLFLFQLFDWRAGRRRLLGTLSCILECWISTNQRRVFLQSVSNCSTTAYVHYVYVSVYYYDHFCSVREGTNGELAVPTGVG